jgi:Tfp pilus assembly protein PilF
VTMDAGNSVTHHALGEAYRAMGQMEDANRELRLAVSLQHKGER